ncbi:MAG: 1,4-dihydroxy-2-naphthoate octaprenyltransferase [Bdellovibrionales bacterium]|nr:1,4-dihydroxy-2-naphthoate octaprenyltransferase [Bdellovibrionales bacterium]
MAIRPRTLTASVVPILVGTSLAYRFGHQIHWEISLWALISALFIQIGTNLFNDVIDFRNGADTAERLGPQRVTQSGVISSGLVMKAGVFCFLLASLSGIPLILQGGWVIVGIGLISLFLGYAYTGGPFPLAYKGLGDLFVVLFFGLVAVGAIYYLHTGDWSFRALVAGLQVGFLATVLIAINNFRDMEQDSKANKKTLAVRWGSAFARKEIQCLFWASFLLCVYWWIEGAWGAALFPLFLWPVVMKLVKQIYIHDPGAIYNRYLSQAGLLHFLFGIQLSLGFLVT